MNHKVLSRARFDVASTTRQFADLEGVISRMQRAAAELTQFVIIEETRTHISNPKHCRYSLAAIGATERLNRLKNSVAVLQLELERARVRRDRTLEKLSSLEAEVSLSSSIVASGPAEIGSSVRASDDAAFAS
jgi:flagellar FliJ protein